MSDDKPKLSASRRKANTLSASFAARDPFIVIPSPEETRIKGYIFEAAKLRGYQTVFWSVSRGFSDLSGKLIMGDRGQGDVDGALDAIRENKTPIVWVMLDLLPWITPPIGLITQRKLRDLIEDLPKQDSGGSIVMLTSSAELPPEIRGDATVIPWPMPDRDEMAVIMDDACEPVLASTDLDEDGKPVVSEEIKQQIRASTTGAARWAAVDAAIGLTGSEAAACFARSIVTLRRIDPLAVAAEKKQLIAQDGAMQYFEPLDGGFLNVGGLENWKDWATTLRLANSPGAREYGLEPGRGAMLIGMSGCGKTLSARALGAEWGWPTIRLDLNAMKGKFVGDSEARIRKTFGTIDALGQVIVYVDEVEKALEGAVSGSADGGVSSDALGAILTWMQDRPGEAFIIMTANDPDKLPPEFMRKGRFDEVWWIDLPTAVERAQVVRASLRKRGRNADQMDMDLDAVAAVTDTFTGAEIDALIKPAMFTAFADGKREITTQDLINAAKDVVPLAKAQEDKIKALREKWQGRAKPATKPDAPTQVTPGRTGSRRIAI